MLQLSCAHIDEFLALLNQPETLRSWKRVGVGEPRRLWRANEGAPMYTAGERYWLLKMMWLGDRLDVLRQTGRPGPWMLLSVDDFFSYSGKKACIERDLLLRLSFTPLPVEAFRIASSVFFYDPRVERWRERPWLGADHDPLLRLPYTRKYDRERNKFADIRMRRHWERLSRAADLLEVAADRLSSIECPWLIDDFSQPTRPDLSDVQEALIADDLMFVACDLSASEGRTSFELVLFEYQWTGDGRYERRALRPALASGSYEGVLAEVRFKSAATRKAIDLRAIEQLQKRVHELLYPLSFEEQEARLREVEKLRDETLAAFSR